MTNEMTSNQPAIVMYGTPWCGDCKRSRRFLESKGVAYEYIDIEDDVAAAAEVARLNGGYQSVPTIVFADGSVLVEPSNKALAEKVGITV